MWLETIREISGFGGTPLYIAIMLSFLLTNHFTEFLQLFVALILAYVIVMAIRFSYWTKRPDYKNKPKNLWEKFDEGSFPSMHVIRAIILAVVISLFFSNLLITFVTAITVLLVSWSRMHLDRHYLHDVVIAKPIGLAIIWLTIKYIVPIIL
ncbi:MAG: phosphatase PAP2 family protein [Nanoarchaeota archaeon]